MARKDCLPSGCLITLHLNPDDGILCLYEPDDDCPSGRCIAEEWLVKGSKDVPRWIAEAIANAWARVEDK